MQVSKCHFHENVIVSSGDAPRAGALGPSCAGQRQYQHDDGGQRKESSNVV